MNLFRLSVSVILMLAMMLGTYMLPQWAGGGLTMSPMESVGLCTEQAPGEDTLRSPASPEEQHSTDGCAANLYVFAEEETDGDAILLSELEFDSLSQGRERSRHAPRAHSSHITSLSRRPPRLSIA